MLLDCAIIGGGPAGLNAALVVARSGRKVILFDEDKPRNAVTQESHGFITRDGITPLNLKGRTIGFDEIPEYSCSQAKSNRYTKSR